MTSPPWAGWARRFALGVALLAAVLGGLAWFGALRVGRWLVVEDPLDRAGVIVVLSGHAPYRAMEAAAIYNAKWAPEVWLTRPSGGAEEADLARLGIDIELGDTSVNQTVLERLGVPPGSIRVLPAPVRNTVEELRLVADEMARAHAARVIIVTSKPHSRRVRSTWRAVVGRLPQAIVRYAESDTFDGRRWWARTSDALAVSREVFGLMNVWAGFPVKPDGAAIAAPSQR